MIQDNFPQELELDLQCYAKDCACVDTAVQSLESIIATQDMIAGGESGLNETAYKLVQHSMESFLRIGRIGMPAGQLMPSLESFNGKYDITEAALESIGSGIKHVFATIIEAIKKAVAWMWGLIKRLFTRKKEHNEKIDKIKHDIADVKEKTKGLNPTQIKSAGKRGADGWFEEVPAGNTNLLRRVVTSKGIMTHEDINGFIQELNQVFKSQEKNLEAADYILKNGAGSGVHYEPPFARCQDQAVVKAVSKVATDEVYCSREFGAGEFIYVNWPAQKGQTDMSWLHRFDIGKTSSPNPPNFKQFPKLTGEMANADKLLEIVIHLNKELADKVEVMKRLQANKDRVIKDLEDKIRKEGVTLFSAAEKKQERNQMTMYLKYFNKVMDQPAVMYYAECDRIITSFEHIAMHVLAFNRRNGNAVTLKA